METSELRVGQDFVGPEGARTVIHVATAGAGDSVAWRNADGSEGGGSASEFLRTYELEKHPHFCDCDFCLNGRP